LALPQPLAISFDAVGAGAALVFVFVEEY
jgi:hypothetical protein